MNLTDHKVRPAYIVFRTGSHRAGAVIRVEGVTYYRVRKQNSRWGRRDMTQLRPLPSGSALFPSAKAYSTQGQKLKKLYWVSYNGEHIETLEQAPDGSMWKDGARTHRDPDNTYKTMRAARNAAARIISKKADEKARDVKALREKARRMKA